MEGQPPSAPTAESLFAGDEQALALFATVHAAVERLGEVETRVGKSQVGFRRRGRSFAAAWRPAQYLRGKAAPLVLTLYLPFRDPSPRWKEVVEPAPGRFTHHLELWQQPDVDAEVHAWLRRAWEVAADGSR